MRVPNIFDYATSELSQDAFLCWLISWAKNEYKDIDNDLHTVAKYFLNFIFEKAGKTLPTITQLEVLKQKYKIDVSVLVNNEYFIIIEDKIYAGKHGNQLERYYKKVNNDYNENKIIPIFLKTMHQDHYNIGNYKLISLDDMITILNYRENISNPIFQDYKDTLLKRKESIEEFNSLHISKWHLGWVGFLYKYKIILTQIMLDGNTYKIEVEVFWGLWMSTRDIDHEDTVNVHLLIKQNKKTKSIAINFMIKVPKKESRRKAKHYWLNRFLSIGKENNIPVKKVDRLGSGLHMAVAQYSSEIVQQSSTNEVLLNHTFKVLHDCIKVIDKAISSE